MGTRGCFGVGRCSEVVRDGHFINRANVDHLFDPPSAVCTERLNYCTLSQWLVVAI